MHRNSLNNYLRKYLDTDAFEDYGPNGLQVEGKEKIERIGFAVSATRESVENAVSASVDALIVHHGLFWAFHKPKPIVGAFAKRVVPLIQNDISLFAYHLPLDAHLVVGNAVSIANKIGLQEIVPFGDHKGSPTGVAGRFPSRVDAIWLNAELEKHLRHKVMHADAEKEIGSMAIITGGANSGWELGADLDMDAYLTGEMSEHDWHESQEAGIHMFAAGHHATERGGVLALMQHLTEKFDDIECLFFDSENPA